MRDDPAKREAAELAALKLDWTELLEEHVWEVMLFDLDQNRSVRTTRPAAVTAFLLFCFKIIRQSNNVNERCTKDDPDANRPGR